LNTPSRAAIKHPHIRQMLLCGPLKPITDAPPALAPAQGYLQGRRE